MPHAEAERRLGSFGYVAFEFYFSVGIVHGEAAVETGGMQFVLQRRVGVDVYVAIIVAVVSELRNDSLSAYLGFFLIGAWERSAYVDVGCQRAEFVVVQNFLQVYALRFQPPREMVFVFAECNVRIAGICADDAFCGDVFPVSAGVSDENDVSEARQRFDSLICVGEFVYGVCRDAQHPDIDEPLGAGIPVAHGAVGREFCAAVCGPQVQGADAQRCACAREGRSDVDRGVERFGIGQQAGYVGKEYFRGFQRAAELQCGHLQFLIFHGVCGCGFAQGQL